MTAKATWISQLTVSNDNEELQRIVCCFDERIVAVCLLCISYFQSQSTPCLPIQELQLRNSDGLKGLAG
jgi:hypothetical protein